MSPRDVQPECELQPTETHPEPDIALPFTAGIGPAGAYCVSLDDEQRERLRLAVFRNLGEPDGAFTLTARAWYARGLA